MTGPGALAVTGGVLLVAAIALGIAVDRTLSRRAGRRYARLGWVMFALACACFIGAVWWVAA